MSVGQVCLPLVFDRFERNLSKGTHCFGSALEGGVLRGARLSPGRLAVVLFREADTTSVRDLLGQ